MSFGIDLLRLECFAMLPVVRPCYVRVLPSLETGCGRYKYSRCSLASSIHKDRLFSVLASSKPPSNAEGEEMDDEASVSELPSVETKPQTSDSEMRARNSAWQSLKVRLPIVGSWFGGEKVTSVEADDTEIKWGGILDPTPDNLLALLLTGLLGLAALQIFWQLVLVAITITLAALKYSVIAAILLTLLIVFL